MTLLDTPHAAASQDATTEADDERDFAPGTTGWRAADLDDPRLESLWNLGRFEIIEGVLTLMAAATFDSSIALQNLIRLIQRHQEAADQKGFFAHEVDVVLSETRIVKADAVFLTTDDLARQREAHARAIANLPARSRRRQTRYGRILIAPTLVIESVSLGHEFHDRQIKRRWYAEARVPHYWILDVVHQTLECHTLDGADYRLEQSGREREEVRPGMFPGLIVPLAEVWVE